MTGGARTHNLWNHNPAPQTDLASATPKHRKSCSRVDSNHHPPASLTGALSDGAENASYRATTAHRLLSERHLSRVDGERTVPYRVCAPHVRVRPAENGDRERKWCIGKESNLQACAGHLQCLGLTTCPTDALNLETLIIASGRNSKTCMGTGRHPFCPH